MDGHAVLESRQGRLELLCLSVLAGVQPAVGQGDGGLLRQDADQELRPQGGLAVGCHHDVADKAVRTIQRVSPGQPSSEPRHPAHLSGATARVAPRAGITPPAAAGSRHGGPAPVNQVDTEEPEGAERTEGGSGQPQQGVFVAVLIMRRPRLRRPWSLARCSAMSRGELSGRCPPQRPSSSGVVHSGQYCRAYFVRLGRGLASRIGSCFAHDERGGGSRASSSDSQDEVVRPRERVRCAETTPDGGARGPLSGAGASRGGRHRENRPSGSPRQQCDWMDGGPDKRSRRRERAGLCRSAASVLIDGGADECAPRHGSDAVETQSGSRVATPLTDSSSGWASWTSSRPLRCKATVGVSR